MPGRGTPYRISAEEQISQKQKSCQTSDAISRKLIEGFWGEILIFALVDVAEISLRMADTLENLPTLEEGCDLALLVHRLQNGQKCSYTVLKMSLNTRLNCFYWTLTDLIFSVC